MAPIDEQLMIYGYGIFRRSDGECLHLMLSDAPLELDHPLRLRNFDPALHRRVRFRGDGQARAVNRNAEIRDKLRATTSRKVIVQGDDADLTRVVVESEDDA